MDAFNLLKADHRKVAELFEQLESASGKQKLTVFDQIKTELELHTHIEETIFYPALEEPKETHDLTLEAYEEHDVVKNLLQQLSKAKSANDEWDAQAKVLQENVEHHVEEEGQLFKKASKALSAEEIENLGEEMEAEKARKQRGASKSSSSKKASSSNKSASKTTAGGRAAKRTRGSSKKSSGSKSSASKTRGRSSSKKSASKKR